MLHRNDQTLIEKYEKATEALMQEEGARSDEEAKWIAEDENIQSIICEHEEVAVQLNALLNEIDRLKAFHLMDTPCSSDIFSAAVALTTEATESNREATMMGEVRALNKAMEKEYQERLARIAERSNAPVDALKHLKPPFIRKNTGGFSGFNVFQKRPFDSDEKAELKVNKRSIGNIQARRGAIWREMDEDARKPYEDKAQKLNEEMIGTQKTMRDRYHRLIPALEKNLTMLRDECGVESICFLAPSKTDGVIKPYRDGYGSVGGGHFYKLMQHGEVELTSRSFIDDFQHEMITYNRAQIAHNAIDTKVASVPSFATPTSSSTTTATTTIIPSTTTTTATNHSVPAPSLVAAADRSISKKNQHRNEKDMRDTIFGRYRQAVQQFYGVHIDDNANMPWKDERMYEDIVMEGWPDIPRDHPSRLSRHAKFELAGCLNNIRFVLAPRQQQQQQQ